MQSLTATPVLHIETVVSDHNVPKTAHRVTKCSLDSGAVIDTITAAGGHK